MPSRPELITRSYFFNFPKERKKRPLSHQRSGCVDGQSRIIEDERGKSSQGVAKRVSRQMEDNSGRYTSNRANVLDVLPSPLCKGLDEPALRATSPARVPSAYCRLAVAIRDRNILLRSVEVSRWWTLSNIVFSSWGLSPCGLPELGTCIWQRTSLAPLLVPHSKSSPKADTRQRHGTPEVPLHRLPACSLEPQFQHDFSHWPRWRGE